jgi:serine/threonine-protein kinase RsbW
VKTEIFTGVYSSLDKIRTFFTKAAKEAGLGERSQFDVQLAADEAASNIIDHAYCGEGKGDIECSYQIFDDKLVLIFKDFGEPFDPAGVEPPDTGSDVCRRKSRGLGLFFMSKLMDEIEFNFDADSGNILRMVKKKC